ncbi:ATP-binding protein [Vibrio cortegadensis]|uniref:histidine kinase n=1 Tax=Vibrio cortegadensis TaxID=1328770 RepID=A0ABV4M571_9VIBR
MPENSPIERKLKREIASRKEAEKLLENKSLELYELNEKLEIALKRLEATSESNIKKLEFEEQIDALLISFSRVFISSDLDAVVLANFLQRLTNNAVIESSYLSLTNNAMNGLNALEYGDKSIREVTQEVIAQDVPRPQWIDRQLCIPLVIEHNIVGVIGFAVNAEISDRDFVEKQLVLAGDLLCSAISRSMIMNRHIESRQRAEESERSTRDFVAMINHELRTPLNGLLGSAELLRDTQLDQIQTDYIDNLSQSGELLRAIINDLLDFSKIDAGMMELIPKKFHWQQLESTLQGIFKPKAAEKRIVLNIGSEGRMPTCFIGDLERITQVLVNLVGNAIKFTHQGEVKLLAVWSDDRINIEVKDSGIGIALQQQEKLFEPFTQADRSSSRHYEGTGLGLAICKRLVDLMGGDISFTSEIKQGTRFQLSLPLTVAQEEVIDTRNPVKELCEKELSQLNVLVVDDIRINQVIINQMLKKMGIKPTACMNGVEALKTVACQSFDVIFMDCRMPEMDGFEATKRLRELGYNLPILALTAGTTLEEREECIQCGMDDILTKPYTADDLKAMLEKWG